jgi:TolB protein
MDADGSNAHPVTTASTSDTAPVWSADGKWIVFGTVDASTDQGSLQIINPDGTGRHMLVTGHLLPWARVSPDSRRIMFTKTEASGASVWIANIDGTDPRRLATGLKASWDGIWSPDGSRIVFAEAPDLNESSPSKQSKIYIAAANGGNRRLLASYPGLIQVPSWSPDGRSIAYQTYTGVKGEADIVLLDVRSGRFRTVTHRAGSYLDECPAWLPDGRLLFQSSRTGPLEVYVMNADGSDVHVLTKDSL